MEAQNLLEEIDKIISETNYKEDCVDTLKHLNKIVSNKYDKFQKGEIKNGLVVKAMVLLIIAVRVIFSMLMI